MKDFATIPIVNYGFKLFLVVLGYVVFNSAVLSLAHAVHLLISVM